MDQRTKTPGSSQSTENWLTNTNENSSKTAKSKGIFKHFYNAILRVNKSFEKETPPKMKHSKRTLDRITSLFKVQREILTKISILEHDSKLKMYSNSTRSLDLKIVALAIKLPFIISNEDIDILIELELLKRGDDEPREPLFSDFEVSKLNLQKETELESVYGGSIKVPSYTEVEKLTNMPLYLFDYNEDILKSKNIVQKPHVIMKPAIHTMMENVDTKSIVCELNVKIILTKTVESSKLEQAKVQQLECCFMTLDSQDDIKTSNNEQEVPQHILEMKEVTTTQSTNDGQPCCSKIFRPGNMHVKVEGICGCQSDTANQHECMKNLLKDVSICTCNIIQLETNTGEGSSCCPDIHRNYREEEYIMSVPTNSPITYTEESDSRYCTPSTNSINDIEVSIDCIKSEKTSQADLELTKSTLEVLKNARQKLLNFVGQSETQFTNNQCADTSQNNEMASRSFTTVKSVMDTDIEQIKELPNKLRETGDSNEQCSEISLDIKIVKLESRENINLNGNPEDSNNVIKNLVLNDMLGNVDKEIDLLEKCLDITTQLEAQEKEVHVHKNPTEKNNSLLKIDENSSNVKEDEEEAKPASDEFKLNTIQNIYKSEKMKTIEQDAYEIILKERYSPLKMNTKDEKLLTYSVVESDIKSMIQDLLLESRAIKETILSGEDLNTVNAGICEICKESDNRNNIEDVQYIMNNILDRVQKETLEIGDAKSVCKTENFQDHHKEKSGGTNLQSGDVKSLGQSSDKLSDFLSPENKDTNLLGEENNMNNTSVYFCATQPKPKILKTSWIFGQGKTSETMCTQDCNLPNVSIERISPKHKTFINNEDKLSKVLEKSTNLLNNIYQELCMYDEMNSNINQPIDKDGFKAELESYQQLPLLNNNQSSTNIFSNDIVEEELNRGCNIENEILEGEQIKETYQTDDSSDNNALWSSLFKEIDHLKVINQCKNQLPIVENNCTLNFVSTDNEEDPNKNIKPENEDSEETSVKESSSKEENNMNNLNITENNNQKPSKSMASRCTVCPASKTCRADCGKARKKIKLSSSPNNENLRKLKYSKSKKKKELSSAQPSSSLNNNLINNKDIPQDFFSQPSSSKGVQGDSGGSTCSSIADSSGYFAEYESSDVVLPVTNMSYVSQQELNTPSEIMKIEENVEINDWFEENPRYILIEVDSTEELES